MFPGNITNCFVVFILALLFLVLTACTTTTKAPVTTRTQQQKTEKPATPKLTINKESSKPKPVSSKQRGYHVVAKGDTLYSISWRYNFDYRDVAKWNEIRAPYVIYPGQVLRLKPVPGKPLATKPAQKKQTVPKPVAVEKNTVTNKQSPQTQQKRSPLPTGPVKWSWPALGKIVKSDSPTAKKGIDISGRPGQVIKAAATGEVVYSGSGLLGYGKLIIIKHNETYLSAYAYNSQILVKEGERVTRGQGISKMGQAHGGLSLLHFEIRKNGKPINPLKFLPKKVS